MQPGSTYRVDSPEFVARLAADFPWVTLVSQTDAGLIASHTPVVLRSTEPLVFDTNFGRADARRHGLLDASRSHSALMIVQGEHDYVSPQWYVGDDAGLVPTWNYEAVHAQCSLEVLDFDENLQTLAELVAHFEGEGSPIVLPTDDETVSGLSRGTIGLRITVESFEAKSKLSQNKSDATRRAVAERLEPTRPYLAARMLETLDSDA